MAQYDGTRTDVRASKTTRVEHVARPIGRERENPPHLGDLRAFVTAAEGLPDELRVFITQGHMSEGGRHDTTFVVTHVEAIADDDPDKVERCPECGHQPHGEDCFNIQSDNDCPCTFNSRDGA